MTDPKHLQGQGLVRDALGGLSEPGQEVKPGNLYTFPIPGSRPRLIPAATLEFLLNLSQH